MIFIGAQWPGCAWKAAHGAGFPCTIYRCTAQKSSVPDQLLQTLVDASHIGGTQARGEIPAGGSGIVEVGAFDNIVERLCTGILAGQGIQDSRTRDIVASGPDQSLFDQGVA